MKKIFHGKYFFAKKRDIKVLTAEILHLRNLYAGQEATVRTGHGITD